MATPFDPCGELPPPGGTASKASTSEGDYEVASASASESTSDLRLQLKAMLAMSKVAPDELRSLIQDAAKEAAVDQHRDVEPSSESDDAASSVGSATDHDDDMDTDGDGNNGNCAGAGNAGTDGYSTVKRKRGSRRFNASKSSKSSNGSYVEPKKKCTESAANQDQDRAVLNRNVYIKGVDFDITKHVTKHPIAFKRSLCRVIGDVAEVKLLNGCLRVTCQNERQRQQLLAATDLDGKTVEVTEPFRGASAPRKASGSGPSTRSARGIIFGVSSELTEEEICEEVDAASVRRLSKYVSGSRQVTENVVITFKDAALPSHVTLGCLRHRVREYVPLPLRCLKCQGFGHHADRCTRGVRCVRCGQAHSLDNCPIKDNPERAVCVNCGGHHSAAYRGCSRYQQVSQVLKVATVNKISYRDALIKVRADVDAVADPGPRSTSTPTPAPLEQRPPRPPRTRQLPQTASTSAVPQATTTRATAQTAPPQAAHGPELSETRTDIFHKRILHYVICLYDVLIGTRPKESLTLVRNKAYKYAGFMFGTCNGIAPCFIGGCSNRHFTCNV